MAVESFRTKRQKVMFLSCSENYKVERAYKLNIIICGTIK